MSIRKERINIGTVEIGRRAEREAAEFLRSLGYVIIARNFTIRGGEADIIAWDSDILVFVEVKSSASVAAEPLESVDERKRKRIALTAERFITQMNLDGVQVRFDAVSVTPEGIKHYKDAFRPEYPL
ncbi:MAG: YraN family protein [candidate division WOR-3 bacterium]